jgi:hypothetical protein
MDLLASMREHVYGPSTGGVYMRTRVVLLNALTSGMRR